MKTIDKTIVDEAGKYVRDLFAKKLPKKLVYHSIDHTVYVVNAAEKIGTESGLNEAKIQRVKVSAWFHDVGFIYSQDDHETESGKIAEKFLNEWDVDPNEIQEVKAAILATRIPQNPTNEIGKILCDADMIHLSTPDYYDHVDLMRKERKALENKKISIQEFDKISLDFFEKHTYHSSYGKNVLQKGKEKNYTMLQENIQKRDEKEEKNA